jgi:uncharacterized protein YehS (DUF1456 family)
MSNNDILRSIRYTFDFRDPAMIEIFGLAGLTVTRPEVSEWLKKEEDPEFKPINDFKLAAFLNGFIIFERGEKDGPRPVPEKKLNNNIILRKLKIALNLRDEDILDIFKKVDREISKHELSAFFRKPEQSQYRECKDQNMRNFLQGLNKKYRMDIPRSDASETNNE